MCWSGRDEIRDYEDEVAAERLAEAYRHELAEWAIKSKRTAEAMLPSLKAWHTAQGWDEREHGLSD